VADGRVRGSLGAGARGAGALGAGGGGVDRSFERPLYRWLRLAAVLVGIYLGGMLLYSALVKAADPHLFVDQIRDYQIFPGLAGFLAPVFVWVELIIGVVLITQVLPRPGLLAVAALMVFFILVTAWAWAHGNASECGCFGRMSARSPKEVIIEDTIWVAMAAAAWRFAPWIGTRRYLGRVRAALAIVLLPVLLASVWWAPRAPIDTWVTSLYPGADLQDLAADDLKVSLGEGSLLLAFLGDSCTACTASLPQLSEIAQMSGAPPVAGVFAGDRRAKRAWVLEHLPAFPVGHAPEKALRQYYRRLPVFVLLRDGKAERIWHDAPPAASEFANRSASESS